MTMKTKMQIQTLKAVIRCNRYLLFSILMISHSDFIFSTSFAPGLAALSKVATTAAVAGSTATTMFGQASPINPVTEIARIKAQQSKIFTAEAALFGIIFLFTCCMMRPPRAKRKFYNDDDEEDEEEDEEGSGSS